MSIGEIRPGAVIEAPVQAKLDNEDIRQILDCLSRGMDANGDFLEVDGSPPGTVLTENGSRFLRE